MEGKNFEILKSNSITSKPCTIILAFSSCYRASNVLFLGFKCSALKGSKWTTAGSH
jgi:hypothetical protein